ncbi:helix-turn-helix transcriptional regulator [Saccharopolyspora shandongensis]|uniref:helix-turn-helix transcriptional regulator n=1 Tax=Saccharopolyspora shandongensis TaxID=418495 RepID=UPI0034031091
MIGRDEELRVVGGVATGGALVIRGEAGIGKSTLLAEVVSGVPGRVLRASGVESEVEIAFSGLHQLLLPVLGEIGGLPEPQADALRRALGAASGETTDRLVCAAVLGLLNRLSERTPVLVVVDDAHDVDRASMTALLFAARRLADRPIGMLFAVRDPAPRAVDSAGLAELRLSGLDGENAARLLDELGTPVDGPTRDRLVAATAGNPLALTTLGRSADRDRLALDALSGTVPVDSALRAAFTAQLQALPTETQAALLVAAADDTGRLDLVESLEGPLDPAEQAGLVEVSGGRLRFAHPLARAATYSSATSGQVGRAHRRIAAALAATDPPRARWHRCLATAGPDETLAAELETDAHDAEARGGLAATASVLLHAARLSPAEADQERRTAAAAHVAWKSGHVGLARTLLSRISGNTPTQVRTRGLVELYSSDQVMALHFLRRHARAAHLPDQAGELFFLAADAALHADRLGDARRLARQVADLPGFRDYGRWLADVLELRVVDAEPWEVFDAAPESVRRSGAHRWLLPMLLNRFGRDPWAAREFGLAAHEQLRTTGMLAISAIALPWLVELECRLGLWADAAEHAEEGLHLARDTGQRPREADFLSQLALLAAWRGDVSGCRRHAQLALERATPVHNNLAAAQATWALAVSELASGDVEQASDRLAVLSAPGLPKAHEHIARLAAADAVEAHVRAGRVERIAETSIDPSNPPWLQAVLHRCRALAEDSEEHHRLSTSDVDDFPFERARGSLLHGQWLRRERRPAEARAELRVGIDLFESLGARQWAERARSELRACGGSAPRGDVAALTAQEREVAALAARGLSNREIAARLFISHRTVGYHLHKVFPKLGIASRGQLRGFDLEP